MVHFKELTPFKARQARGGGGALLMILVNIHSCIKNLCYLSPEIYKSPAGLLTYSDLAASRYNSVNEPGDKHECSSSSSASAVGESEPCSPCLEPRHTHVRIKLQEETKTEDLQGLRARGLDTSAFPVARERRLMFI